jgi:hypothetical protein
MMDADIISKILVPTGQLAVAIAVGCISYSQWRTAENQKKIAQQKIILEMFDRRFKIYETVVRVISEARIHQMDERLQSELREGVRGVQFLFSREIEDITNKIQDVIFQSRLNGKYIIAWPEIEKLVEEFKIITSPFLVLGDVKRAVR